MPLPSAACTRRQALIAGGLSLASTLWDRTAAAQSSPASSGLIRGITQQTIWDNLDGQSTSWFHPRGCMIPNGSTPLALMTLQEITGSDYFGPVHWTTSTNLGRDWSKPEPIPSLGRFPVEGHEGLLEGVCDVVPEYHPPTRSVLAVGHCVYYRGDRFSRGDQLARYPVYAVRRPDGSWKEKQRLEWGDPRGATIYTNGCGQRVTLPDGDILLALSFAPDERPRDVAGARCSFDGERLAIKDVGPPLSHAHGRGLLEPSLTRFRDRVYLTIRAEDNHGYVAVSDDGLKYGEKQPWTFDDGEPLAMSTTQQHWLTHSDGLFLVYNRKDASNEKVIRWRSPLYVAQVDPERLRLIRATEKIVLPLLGDGVKEPDRVPLMGNFHVNNASPTESWVTVGSWQPRHQAKGQTLLARIDWTRPNTL